MVALKGIAEQFTPQLDNRKLRLSGQSDTLDSIHSGYSVNMPGIRIPGSITRFLFLARQAVSYNTSLSSQRGGCVNLE